MEYLQPLKNLENKILLYRIFLIASLILAAIAIIGIPITTMRGNPVVINFEDSVALSKKDPWKLSVMRVETFMKDYLSSRFEWNQENFSEKRAQLKSIATDEVVVKLKDSLSAFESLAKSQNAQSYYVLEGFGFSNEKHQIEAHITRVLRIQKVAVATPLIVQFQYHDVAVSADNPYGLVVTSLSELEVN